MPHRVILFLVIAAAIISSAQLISVVLSTSPYTASQSVLWEFYVSAFISSSCILGMIIHGIRVRFNKVHLLSNLLTSLRQAALITTVILLSLFFNTLSILKLWDMIPLVLAAVLIEFFFQAEKRPHAHLEYEE